MKNWWHRISNVGLDKARSDQDESRWRLTNQLALLIVVVSVLSLFSYPAYIDEQTGTLNGLAFLRIFTGLGVGILAFGLSSRGNIKAAKLALIVFSPLIFLGFSWLEASFLPIDILWVPVMVLVHPVAPHLLYHPRTDRKFFIGALVFTFLLLLAVEPIVFSGMGESTPVQSLIEENYVSYKVLYIYYFLFLNGGLFYLNFINGRLEKSLRKRIAEVEEQKEEISLQHQKSMNQQIILDEQLDEVLQQSEEIKQINENLEFMVQERTQELEQQNHQLAEYAFINGHLLRAPLCRVQGLIYLMELSDKLDKEDPMYLHLKESVEEFSNVVSHINRLVEEGQHFDRYEFVHSLPDSKSPQPTTD